MRLTHKERSTLLSLAAAVTPEGRVVPQPDQQFVDRLMDVLGAAGVDVERAFRASMRAVNLASVPLCGKRLTSLDLGERIAMLQRLNGGAAHTLVRGFSFPIKLARAGPRLASAMGIEGQPAPKDGEPARWRERAQDAAELDSDELEVDCVVVGSGAGGAPMAHALASRGHSVLILEEGGFFGRVDFGRDPLRMQELLYRKKGLTAAIGNTVIPIPTGKAVGGTTVINSGTCFRVGERVLRRWQLDHGLHALGPGSLDPYYEKVESMLRVSVNSEAVLGPSTRLFAKGCEALGYAHGPLPRNAPECTGLGVCCFGCPTGAKRSTDVSYVPEALKRGAMLFYNARVSKVLVERGRAVGVVARVGPGGGQTLTVRAATVVLACGTIGTPNLLMRQDLDTAAVGRHLTIHPAGYVWARFGEKLNAWNAVPQGYGCDEFVDQGLRIEGSFIPLSMAAASMSAIGPQWTDFIESYNQLASFGFMVADTSRGRVRLGPGGQPRIQYWLNQADSKKIVQGYAILARIFEAAGADRVYAGIRGFEDLSSPAAIRELEQKGASSLRARHFDLTAYHPLGTCRMGANPRTSVVGDEGEAHHVANLFICDGSAVPGPLDANPQLTIMALSERSSQFVEERIEQQEGRATLRRPQEGTGPALQFHETMAGECQWQGEERALSFTITSHAPLQAPRSLSRFAVPMEIEGILDFAGVANRVPCRGALTFRPLSRKGTLLYHLDFEADDGTALRLEGEKNVALKAVWPGMTTLFVRIKSQDGAVMGEGVLRFAREDLLPWLRSFQLV